MSAHATEARSAGRERPALKPLLAGFVFSLLALVTAQVAPSIEIGWVMAFLFLIVLLLAMKPVLLVRPSCG